VGKTSSIWMRLSRLPAPSAVKLHETSVRLYCGSLHLRWLPQTPCRRSYRDNVPRDTCRRSTHSCDLPDEPSGIENARPRAPFPRPGGPSDTLYPSDRRARSAWEKAEEGPGTCCPCVRRIVRDSWSPWSSDRDRYLCEHSHGSNTPLRERVDTLQSDDLPQPP